MKRAIGLWQFFGFALTSFLGTLLHFLYEWLGNPWWIAPFSGVNESTWEHMKLLFWPMLIFAVIESFFFKEREDFWCIKLKGLLTGLVLIPIIFYTYNGVIGKSPDLVNIAIFFVSAAAAFIYETRQFKKDAEYRISPKSAIAVILIIAVMFVIFSFNPPKIGIFKDPASGEYGIKTELSYLGITEKTSGDVLISISTFTLTKFNYYQG